MEFLYLTGTSSADGPLPRDRLLPTGRRSRAGWVEQDVNVLALVNDHVIAAGQPMEIAGGSGDIGSAAFSSGVMLVWSATSPADAPLHRLELRAASHTLRARATPDAYPARSRDTWSRPAVVPRFGTPGARPRRAIFRDELSQQLWALRGRSGEDARR